MTNAEAIIADPNSYTTLQFKKAIEDLEAAYQTAQDYATGIEGNEELRIKNEESDTKVYDLSGRRTSLRKGIHIIGGRIIYTR